MPSVSDRSESGVAGTDPDRLLHRSRRDAGEDRHLTKRLIDLVTRSAPGLDAIRFGQENQLLWRLDRQAPKQYGIRHTEDRRVDADPQGKRGDCNSGKAK